MCEQKRHKWADVIHAYAEGKEIQWKRDWGQWPTEWLDYSKHPGPGFDSTVVWRIKPEKKTYWANVYRYNKYDFRLGKYFRSEEEAKEDITDINYIKTISFEVEE